MKIADIRNHPLLTPDQAEMCEAMAKIAKKTKVKFELLNFAEIALRATGNDYADLRDSEDVGEQVDADLKHKRAAILYVYEAVRALGCATPEFLKTLEVLSQEVP